MYYYRRDGLNIFLFQTLFIASVVGVRSGSWDVFLLTMFALLAAWSLLSRLGDEAILNISLAMGAVWAVASIFIARAASTPLSAFFIVLFAFCVGFSGNFLAFRYSQGKY